MSDQRLFDDETSGQVLRRAAELQHESNVPVHGGDGLSAADLEQIATEAGIDAAFVRRAIVEAKVSSPETQHVILYSSREFHGATPVPNIYAEQP